MSCPVAGCGLPLASTNKNGYCTKHRNSNPVVKRWKAEWYLRNKGRVCESRKARRNTWDSTYHKYKITAAEFHARAAKQGGRCGICRALPGAGLRSRLFVDHCHTTGRVRGLLCGGCNFVLGHAKDSAETLMKAAEYLYRHEQETDDAPENA